MHIKHSWMSCSATSLYNVSRFSPFPSLLTGVIIIYAAFSIFRLILQRFFPVNCFWGLCALLRGIWLCGITNRRNVLLFHQSFGVHHTFTPKRLLVFVHSLPRGKVCRAEDNWCHTSVIPVEIISGPQSRQHPTIGLISSLDLRCLTVQ